MYARMCVRIAQCNTVKMIKTVFPCAHILAFFFCKSITFLQIITCSCMSQSDGVLLGI